MRIIGENIHILSPKVKEAIAARQAIRSGREVDEKPCLTGWDIV
jgi:hypothetical protein